jgi:hypothetical protein
MDEDGVWSVARRARKGHLVLFYRVLPEGFVADIFLVAGEVTNEEVALTHSKSSRFWVNAFHGANQGSCNHKYGQWSTRGFNRPSANLCSRWQLLGKRL